MNFKKYHIAPVLLTLQIFGSSCAKIDPFNSPHMLEGFTGIVKVTPGIEGITAKTYSPGLIFFNSNGDGTEVTMYGPNTENFSLYNILPNQGDIKDDSGLTFRDYMKKFKGISELDKLDFSGFKAHVDPDDGRKIHFYDFGDESLGMSQFHWKVEGDGFIAGPDSVAMIRISTDVGTLQRMLPTKILKGLAAPNSDVSVADFEDKSARVYLAGIQVLSESLTFGY